MTDTNKLAQVLAEHRFRVAEFDGAVCDCGTVVTPSVNSTTIKAAWPAHQAAVVLAHLTAEGQPEWEWGVKPSRSVFTCANEAQARKAVKLGLGVAVKRPVWRGEWETI